VRKLTNKPYDWQPYTPQLLADLQKKDQVVLVEFTATWCANCHTLEAAVINSDKIQTAVKSNKVWMVKADITDHDKPSFQFWKFGIQAEGVPLTLIYPAGKKEPVQLYGMYSADDLQKAIEQAAKKSAMR
jgi:thiol:disulfide interchange protein DsbD